MLGPSANSPPCGSRCRRRRGCRTRCRPLLSAVLRRPSSSVLLLMLLLVLLFSTLPLVFLVMFLSSVFRAWSVMPLEELSFVSHSYQVRFPVDWSLAAFCYLVTFLVWFADLSHAFSFLSPHCAPLARQVHRPASGQRTLSLQVVLCHIVSFAGLTGLSSRVSDPNVGSPAVCVPGIHEVCPPSRDNFDLHESVRPQRAAMA